MFTYYWHIFRFPYSLKKEHHALQANTWHQCKAKVGKNKHGTLAPTYRGSKKEFCSNNHIPTNIWFYTYDITIIMFDWPNIPTMWLVKFGTNLTWKEVFTLENVAFQLQRLKTMSSCRCLGTNTQPSYPLIAFSCFAKPKCSSHHMVSNSICCNMAALLVEHINKWKNALHMDGK